MSQNDDETLADRTDLLPECKKIRLETAGMNLIIEEKPTIPSVGVVSNSMFGKISEDQEKFNKEMLNEIRSIGQKMVENEKELQDSSNKFCEKVMKELETIRNGMYHVSDQLDSIQTVVRQTKQRQEVQTQTISKLMTELQKLRGKEINIEKNKKMHSEVVRFDANWLTGKTIPLEMKLSETVHDMKIKFQEKEGIPADQQRIIFNGRHLEDEKTLKESGIRNCSVLQIFLRMIG